MGSGALLKVVQRESVFRNLNPNANKHSLHSGKNHLLNFHVPNFQKLHVNSSVDFSVRRLEKDLAASVNPSVFVWSNHRSVAFQ